jgi:hypothetical protein
MAGCRIEYLEEKVVHTALAPTLEKAAVVARANLSEVKRLYGATGYRILDNSSDRLLDLHDAESM